MESIKVSTPSHNYNIVFEKDYIQLASLIDGLDKNYSKIGILTDDHVGPLYSKALISALTPLNIECHLYAMDSGEINKNYKTMNQFYDFLISNRFDRHSLLIALGGGVVGDMTGFTAATYMRGVDFIQAPTSLLAQVDSSVGGKTGIDFNGYKNIIGAFYQPQLVYVNTTTLKTLDPIEFASGMGEALKHGLIMDASYFDEMIASHQSIKSFSHDAIANLIGKSCQIKSAIVSQDDKEHGIRAILNFVHTIGHAVERLADFSLPHGHCVALGVIASTHIAMKLDQLSIEAIEKIKSAMLLYDLPITVSGLTVDDVYRELFYDKKTKHNQLNIIMLDKIGQCHQNTSLTELDIKEGIRSILI